MPDLSKYLTVEETAEKLELHPDTVRVFLRYKKFDGIKVGQMWFVSQKSVADYRAANQGQPKHGPRRTKK